MIQPINYEPAVRRTGSDDRARRSAAARPRLLDQVRHELRLGHYAYKTEKTYLHWIVRYVRFHHMRHPEEMGAADITRFLTHLAVGRHVAESTQNQALNALIFLYKKVLRMDVGDLRHVRAAKPEYLPVVLTMGEVDRIMQHMKGTYLLLAELMYGTGMRINEVLRLRVMDIDFERSLMTVRQGKNRKDRSALLPTWTIPALKEQLKKAKALHEKDLEDGLGTANLPYALDRKYPNASREWKWQFVFPSTRISTDPRSGRRQRHHLYDTNLQRHIRKAAQKTGIQKHVKSHTLRHSFATHLLEAGSDIRTIQELLGHADVKTTMIYTHVLKKGPLAVDSPLDRMRALKEQSARVVVEDGTSKSTIIAPSMSAAAKRRAKELNRRIHATAVSGGKAKRRPLHRRLLKVAATYLLGRLTKWSAL